jgi:hypothetical protein
MLSNVASTATPAASLLIFALLATASINSPLVIGCHLPGVQIPLGRILTAKNYVKIKADHFQFV